MVTAAEMRRRHASKRKYAYAYADGGQVDDWTVPAGNDWVVPKETPAPSQPTMGSLAKQTAMGVGRGLLDLAGTAWDTSVGRLASGYSDIKNIYDATKSGSLEDQAKKVRELTKGRGMFETGSHLKEGAGLEGQNAPQNFPERLASGIGEGASGAVLGGPQRAVANAVIGGVGGGVGRTAAEAVPDKYKPYAELVGNILGGGAAGLAESAARSTPAIASRISQPFTKQGQETLAGRYLLSRASNPETLEQSLTASAWPKVDGSNPTTFQLSGDMGLGSLEREVATKNPAEFMARRAEQNAARLDAMTGVQETGSPQAVSAAVNRQLADVDAMTQRGIDAAMKDAQGKAAVAGSALERAENTAQGRSTAALRNAQESAQGLGGREAQDVYGNRLRSALIEAEETARSNERRLWSAVDPNNDLTMNMAPIKRAYQDIYGNLSQAADATLKPIEQTVKNVISQYKPVEQFRELTDLRSLVSSAMREEMVQNGRTPAYARLARLRGNIEGSINGAIEDRVAADAANVAAGRLAPEDSVAALIQKQVADWRAQRGESLASGVGEVGSARTPTVSPAPRAEGAVGEQFADVAGNPSLQANFDQAAAERLRQATTATRERAQTFGAQPLKGVLQREGQSGPFRMREAAVPSKIFHPGDTGFEDVQTFRRAVGDDRALPVLRDYAASSLRESALTPEGVIDPARFERWRTQHAETLRAFPNLEQRFATAADATKALNTATASNDIIRKVSDEFRRSVLTKDGIVDSNKFDAWRRKNSSVLRDFPDFDKQFSSAAKASEAIGNYTDLRRSALKEAQEGALGRFIGVTDPQDAVRAVGSILGGKNSVAEMRRLVGQTKSDPAAQEGLRKAVIDHMTGKLLSNAEAATSGKPLIKADQFQNFVKNNSGALELVFTPQEMQTFRAIAADLQRANRSITAVKLPGQSNTAQDLAAASSGQSRLATMLLDAAKSGAGFVGNLVPGSGMISAAGSHVANAVRTAGFSNVEGLVKQAMLDPEFARLLLTKVPATPTLASDRIFARRLMFLTAAEMARQAQNERKK